jgi:hypothetical protein
MLGLWHYQIIIKERSAPPSQERLTALYFYTFYETYNVSTISRHLVSKNFKVDSYEYNSYLIFMYVDLSQ